MTLVGLVLSIAFLIKHFLGDFPLQTAYMLRKGRGGIEWILPLGAHCAVHAFLSGAIILFARPELAWLAVVEFAIHFVVDRIKATYKLPAGQWGPDEKGKYLGKYYQAFGVDQLAHGMTYVVMVYILTN